VHDRKRDELHAPPLARSRPVASLAELMSYMPAGMMPRGVKVA
jgi:hypothetical protein